jgi:hypothetical protein
MITTTKVSIGSISSGTIRAEDLIPTFLGELDSITGETHKAWEEVNAEGFEYDSEDGLALLEDLWWALSDLCPPFVTFGASEGDGACFGFWPDLEALFEAHYAKEQWSEDAEYTYLEDDNLWIHVNDHGNVAVLTNDDGKPGAIIWDCV